MNQGLGSVKAKWIIAAAIVAALQTSSMARGEDSRMVGGKKRQNIDFSDELVEGKAKSPELFYLLQKKQINFGRLIKLRENFLPEMKQTAEDVKRSGGND